ncbi:MAG: FliH/SctL family protein, partial [Candidatus Binataceae bacterium]
MKATAKYLFDEDFATGESPTITVVEAERRRADAESIAYRNGFTAAQAQTAQRTAAVLALIADGLERLDRSLASIEARLESEAVEVAVAVA